MSDRDQSIDHMLDLYMEDGEKNLGLKFRMGKVYDYLLAQSGAGMGGWISVEDRLPEIGSYVLAIGGEVLRIPYPARLCKGEDGPEFWFGITPRKPTHWQPLPTPPSLPGETKSE